METEEGFNYEVAAYARITGGVELYLGSIDSIRRTLEESEKNPRIYRVCFSLPNGERLRFVRRDPTFWDKLFFWREAETEWVYQPI